MDIAEDGGTQLRSRLGWLILVVLGVPAAAVGAGIQGYTQGGKIPGIGGLFGGLIGVVAGLLVNGVLQTRGEHRLAVLGWNSKLERLPRSPIMPLGIGLLPSELLSAEREAFQPLWGRGTDSRRLLKWVADWDDSSLAVLVGGPLVGKTRLTIHLARELGDQYRVGRLKSGAVDVVSTVAALPEPTLIVIETPGWRPELPEVIEDLTRCSGRVKVLLVTRETSWLQYLRSRLSDEAAATVDRGQIIPLAARGGSRDLLDVSRQASEIYAKLLKRAQPAGAAKGPAPATPIGLVLAEALLRVLSGGTSGQDDIGLSEELARHERARWPEPTESAISDLLRRQAVAAMLLLGSSGSDQAVLVLRRLPDLEGASNERLREIATWVGEIYPDNDWAVPPVPGLISHGLVMPLLQSDERLRSALTAKLDALSLGRVFAFLIAASVRFPLASDYAAQLLSELGGGINVSQLLTTAIATPPNQRVDQVLAALIEDPRFAADASKYKSIFGDPNRYPRSYVAFRLAEANVAQKTLSSTAPDPTLNRLRVARSLSELGQAYRNVAKPREACDTLEQAVNLWRGLISEKPAGHAQDLAAALSDFGAAQAENGQLLDTLSSLREAVDHWEVLASDSPEAHIHDLATAITHLGTVQAENGHLGDALATQRQAVDLWQTVTSDNPKGHAHTHELATALTNLSNVEYANGLLSESLATKRQAIDLWRGLVAEDPDAYTAGLATSLAGLAEIQHASGHILHALSTQREATRLWQGLTRDNPDAHGAGLASSLTTLGQIQQEGGQILEAMSSKLQAVVLWRKLARVNPSAHTAGLAAALTGLGDVQRVNGSLLEALATERQAVNLWEELFAQNPVAHGQGLAKALVTLGMIQGDQRHWVECLASERQAVDLWQSLRIDNPNAHRCDLAIALTNLGASQAQSGDLLGALGINRQAVALWETLASGNPEAHASSLAGARSNLSMTLSLLGKEDDF